MAISWKPNLGLLTKIPKVAGIGGLIAGAAVALPIAALSIRNSRRPAEDDVPMAPELSAPIPQVFEAPVMLAQPQTLMGEQVVEGDFAKRYKNQRAGLAAGPDVTPPNLTRADGRNAIDGSLKVEELGRPGGRVI